MLPTFVPLASIMAWLCSKWVEVESSFWCRLSGTRNSRVVPHPYGNQLATVQAAGWSKGGGFAGEQSPGNGGVFRTPMHEAKWR